jgi:hypothetical protein
VILSKCSFSCTYIIRFDRDGEVVSISRYAHCSDESCCCKSSTGSEDLNCGAVTLKLWKGFYHERYRDIMKVFSTITFLLLINVKPSIILATSIMSVDQKSRYTILYPVMPSVCICTYNYGVVS